MEEMIWLFGECIIALCNHPILVGSIVLFLIFLACETEKSERRRLERFGYHIEKGREQARKRGNRNGYK